MQKYLRGIYYRFALYWKASDIEETGLEDVRGTVYIENAVLYNYDDRQVCTESISASDWCALQEALYKFIDTIQYNTISDDIIFMARVVKEIADESQDFAPKVEKSKGV